MEPARPNPMLVRGIDRLGRSTRDLLMLIGGTATLAASVGRWYWRSATGTGLRVGWPAVVAQMVRVGVRSIGIVLIVSACIGLILAISMYPPLAELGQQNKIANIVGVAVLREMGPIISAVVLTGFAGASIAAEIGTMVVGEEIEALEAHALDPIRFLVLPRLTATAISLLLLTVLADITAVICSGFVTVMFFDVSAAVYIDNTLAQLNLSDFLTGLIKATMAMDDDSALEAQELQGSCHGFQQILRRHTQHLSIGLQWIHQWTQQVEHRAHAQALTQWGQGFQGWMPARCKQKRDAGLLQSAHHLLQRRLKL